MYYVGIDVGGTNLKAGVVDENGHIIAKVDCPTKVERGHEAVVADMAKLALRAIEKSGVSMDEVKSVGIGIPGILDPRTGIVPFCTNLGWHNVPLIELMQKDVHKPIYVDNDATVATLAENVAGVSAGAKSSVFLTLGTGVGGGVVIDGKVYSGAGCWERYASATALIRMGTEAAKAHPESVLNEAKSISAKTVVDAAKAGDKAAMEVFDRYTYYLAVGIVNIINFVDPEIIAIGGGVSAAGEFLIQPVREKLAKLVFYKTMPYARVELATLGNDAGIIGAAMLGK